MLPRLRRQLRRSTCMITCAHCMYQYLRASADIDWNVLFIIAIRRLRNDRGVYSDNY